MLCAAHCASNDTANDKEDDDDDRGHPPFRAVPRHLRAAEVLATAVLQLPLLLAGEGDGPGAVAIRKPLLL